LRVVILILFAYPRLGLILGRVNPQRPSEEIGRAVRQRREALAMTQEELAAKAGVSKTTVQTVEGGTFRHRPYRLKQIADALEVTVAWLEGVADGEVAPVAPSQTERRYASHEDLVNAFLRHLDAVIADPLMNVESKYRAIVEGREQVKMVERVEADFARIRQEVRDERAPSVLTTDDNGHTATT
jgi:transcriptional regulator with XRE-family HTH domain